MKCENGCGKEAIHQLKNGKWICSKSHNGCQVKRDSDASKKRGKTYKEIYGGHKPGGFKNGNTPWNIGKKVGPNYNNPRRINIEDILNNKKSYTNTSHLKARLISEGYKKHRCEICNLTEWMGKPVPTVLDHIDGDSSNNRLENLRIVCSNCDAQLPTFKSKNKNSKRKRKS